MLQKNLKVKSLGLSILVLLNLLLIPFYSSTAQYSKVGINSALNSIDISIEEINVNAHVGMEDVFLSSYEAETKAVNLAAEFKMENYAIEDFSTWDNTQIILQGNSKEFYQTTIIVQATDIPEVTETNIVVDIIAKDSSVEMTLLEEKVRNLLDTYGKVDINSNITASHSGKLTIIEQKEVMEHLMKKMEVEEVESFTDNQMISVTGYTSLIKEWKQYGNKKVNINIAMRYNSYEDKTNLWIGTPFITIGY